MGIDSPKNTGSLVSVIENGKEYVVTEAIDIMQVPTRGEMPTLVLKPGDVITVRTYDAEKGLLFSCGSQASVIVSPAQAQKIQVETE